MLDTADAHSESRPTVHWILFYNNDNNNNHDNVYGAVIMT